MSEEAKADITNSLGYERDLFCSRVETAMKLAKVDYETLSKRFLELGYSINASNLRTYITQRNPSLKLLIFLSKSLNVSMDYLIGNESGHSIYLNENFDHEFDSARYKQYPGTYSVYFYPTRTNEVEELIEAKLTIKNNNGYLSTLEIPVEDGKPKTFNGHLILSKKTCTAFLNMIGSNGEIIQFIFNDPNTNQNKIRFCVSSLVSVSSGDAKRMPTLSRAIISEQRITDTGHKFLNANLLLNSKYINIHEDVLMTTLQTFLEKEKVEDIEGICKRLGYAFKPKTYYSILEQYFLNTFREENKLSDSQIEHLIAELRNRSMSNVNIKTPRTLDSRLYLLMKEENMFVVSKE